MSSATRLQPDAWRRMSNAIDPQVFDRLKRLGLSPRQMELNRLWSYYKTAQYDARKTEWDGSERRDPIEREAITSQGFVPGGFIDAGANMSELPLKYRAPSVPYHLVKVVVNRFTGMLFSERRHPKIDAVGDPATEDWVNALAEVARLWPTMASARNYGGAMGCVAVGFAFIEGQPVFEVHDPRWLTMEWADRAAFRLRRVEKRYQYPIEIQHENGNWEEVPHWYRRVIDEQTDTLWKPVPVGDGEEPNWADPMLVEQQVTHGFGECPVRWAQNLPVEDDIDGEPDCQGIYELVEAIDMLLSQAHTGTNANCDPTVALEGIGDTEIPPLKKGSRNAIKLPQGTVRYVEITGSGPAAARELARELRGYALEVAQCVLDHPDVAGRTATEIERLYSSMLAKADVLREQYGVRLVIPLLAMVIRAARRLETPVIDPVTNQVTRQKIILPPRVDPDSGAITPRVLGPEGTQLTVHWPPAIQPSLADAEIAGRAAGFAKNAGLIDEEAGAKFLAPFFGIEDVKSMMKRAEAEYQKRADQMSGLMASGFGTSKGGGAGEGEDIP